MKFIRFKDRSIKEQNKIYPLFIWVANFSLIAIMLFFFWIMVYNPMYINKDFYSDLHFEGNFTQEEKQFTLDILSQVKENYLLKTKKMYIVKEYIEGYDGSNRNGIIYIKFYPNEKKMKKIICHEIIHQLVNKFTKEYFVYDITSYGVCYK